MRMRRGADVDDATKIRLSSVRYSWSLVVEVAQKEKRKAFEEWCGWMKPRGSPMRGRYGALLGEGSGLCDADSTGRKMELFLVILRRVSNRESV